ncbi:hypothetical protein PHAGE6E_90 [Staphylococcus phage 6ec]|uniref:Uncharacterized protein n=1 Tax=Staphylococcus phage 6ec TaxID=1500386 RepID=A0A060AEZ9_9CAUD|nr:hypothetical protein PHAGE6E_90 [Staphylococcus phage 6ec]AIA64116.1 hypothetical protein PHAGE6E_90 [Staphylococcus phage 6ec]
MEIKNIKKSILTFISPCYTIYHTGRLFMNKLTKEEVKQIYTSTKTQDDKYKKSRKIKRI